MTAKNPALYQINTRAYLGELSKKIGKPATLDDVPDSLIADLVRKKFDYVWFLGVWQTGLVGRKISQSNEGWIKACRDQLPDLDPEKDITGSPFAIVSYTLNKDFGAPKELLNLKKRLNAQGIKLILDFVPNHTAIDCPWAIEHPEYYIHGTEDEKKEKPQNYIEVGKHIIAHGRDPNYDGWPDTLQLNYRHNGFRKEMTQQLLNISELCDGIRCDMAMLLLPDIFRDRTWKNASLPWDTSFPNDDTFWAHVIPAVKEKTRGNFIFMAEVYWDREFDLQQLGFDYTYDKRLYDRLHRVQTEQVHGHLLADPNFQRKSVRFLENHDEPRAASEFAPNPKHKAAAIISFLAPGLHFFHEGQLEGFRTQVSVHLGRRRIEQPDGDLVTFYDHLIHRVLHLKQIREGNFIRLSAREAWPGNFTFRNFIGFHWSLAGKNLLAIVNYADYHGQCYMPMDHMKWELVGKMFRLTNLMGDQVYERKGDELFAGMYFDVAPWEYLVLEMEEM